jgi:methylaspartate mutase sigma subunit
VFPPSKAAPFLSRRVVLGSTPSDAHTWNLVYLQLVLEEYGFDVENLGACLPVGVLLDACLREPPAMVVLSTIAGHGTYEAVSIVATLRAREELSRTRIVIGGMLTVDGSQDSAVVADLLRLGFDGVYVGAGAMRDFRAILEPTAARYPVVGHAS